MDSQCVSVSQWRYHNGMIIVTVMLRIFQRPVVLKRFSLSHNHTACVCRCWVGYVYVVWHSNIGKVDQVRYWLQFNLLMIPRQIFLDLWGFLDPSSFLRLTLTYVQDGKLSMTVTESEAGPLKCSLKTRLARLHLYFERPGNEKCKKIRLQWWLNAPGFGVSIYTIC